nr:alcohol acetyltransferase [Actinomycetales bacterium]
RISLEVFHALTDGTGALWFFQDLLTEYVGLRHLDEFEAAAPGPVKQDFAPDAFTHWFRTGGSATFAEDATSAVQSPTTRLPEGVRDPGEASARTGRKKRARSDVLRVGGTHTPDNRTRVVELSMPVRPVLALARAEHVSLTIYLLAVFFDALRQTRLPAHGRPRTLTCSVPVNLRQFFPTESGRNFFATTMLEHTYGEGDRTAGAGEGPAGGGGADSIGSVCRSPHEQFQQVVSREGLERKIRRLVRFERNPALRVIPRPAKDLILGTINRWQNLGTTVAISNMGRVELPEPADPHVGRIFLHVSAVRPQFCVVSHGDHLTISFTSPFVETDVHAAFVRTLTEVGVPVEIDVSRVTADEIAAVVEPGTGT